MDPITRQAIAVAGGAGGSSGTYVDDVFSTFLYDGTGSTQSIDNGIDLSGEGGLVWLKKRNVNLPLAPHIQYDTERGATKAIFSNDDDLENTRSGGITAFNSDGFTLGSFTHENGNGNDMCSWTFRKAPGFFDVVTFTGTGSVQNISHSLGSVPGMIVVKKTSGTGSWNVFHRSLGANGVIYLNGTHANSVDNGVWNNTAPTSSVFTVGADAGVNGNGATYIAYVFAHDDQSFGTDSDEAIIKCGSYTGSGSDGNFVNVGFEPQWLMIKNTSSSSTNWLITDAMRGMPAKGGTTNVLAPNSNAAETTQTNIAPNPTGFTLAGAGSYSNKSGNTFIYMAIRRPHKPPTAGTEVFAIDTKTVSSANTPSYISNFPVDLALRRDNITSTSDSFEFISRLANSIIYANTTSTENSGGSTFLGYFAHNNGWANVGGSDSNDYLWMFKRAPGFFDVVTYTGTGSTQNISHNLESVPEMIICKARDVGYNWTIYNSSSGATKRLRFNNNSHSSQTSWNNTAPTSSVFTVGSDANTNNSSTNYIAYLFATLDGISKVGSYTGTGYNVNVDCGFAAGARFILIKRTDNDGDWYVWDTARGIVSGNDPYLLLNSNAAEVTNTDYVDPLNAGFTVTSSAPAALNASGGTYLFLAIA